MLLHGHKVEKMGTSLDYDGKKKTVLKFIPPAHYDG